MTENPVAIADARQTGVFGTYHSNGRQQFPYRENQHVRDKAAAARYVCVANGDPL